MKTALAVTLTVWLFATQALAQLQAYNWFFGDSAWVNFSTGTPVSQDGSNLFSMRGSAAISDSSGSLLFYSDGFHVWDKNHQLAVNGDSLWTNEFSFFAFDSLGNVISYDLWNNVSNSVLILPGFTLRHYELLATSAHLLSDYYPPNGTDPGIVYNDVFMHGDTTEVLLPKNRFLLKDSFAVTGIRDGRLCAIRHANGRDWWIVNKRLLNDSFAVFLFDPYGFHGPYYQTVGIDWSDWASSGEVAVSPQGDRICYTNPNGQIDLYDFDRCTGQLTSYLELGSPPYNQNTNLNKTFYGVAFSPNGTRLYVSDFHQLFQYDLTANDVAATKQPVYTLSPFTVNIDQPDTFSHAIVEMELAPDGKIYFGIALFALYPREINSAHNHYLSVIDSPDALGAACNVQIDVVNLGNNKVLSGLPNFPNYALGKIPGSPCDTLNPPLASFASPQPSVCLGGCVQFENQSTNPSAANVSYQWSFPGGTPSSSSDSVPPVVCYNQAGSYDVTLIATNPFGSDTFTQPNYITVNPPPSVSITPANGTLETAPWYTSYDWFLDGNALPFTTYFIPLQGSGTYAVVVTDEYGCTGQASYVVTSDNALVDGVDFTVSPNPAFAEVNCSWLRCNVVKLELFDALGREVLLQKAVGNNATLDVSALPVGVYALRVFSSNGNALVVKVLVSR